MFIKIKEQLIELFEEEPRCIHFENRGCVMRAILMISLIVVLLFPMCTRF